MEIYFSPQSQIFFQLFLAVILGVFIGLEREYKQKEAGMRTYATVCLGAALFSILGFESYLKTIGAAGTISFDPSRVIHAIAIGVGFLGGGSIIFRQSRVEGLTTAAGLWVAAAVGLAIGLKLYFIAIFATFLTVGIFAGLRLIEKKLFETVSESDSDDEPFK